MRNLVKSVLNNILLNESTEGARTTGSGRAFQIVTILQEKEFLYIYIIFCYSDTIGMTSGFVAGQKSKKISEKFRQICLWIILYKIMRSVIKRRCSRLWRLRAERRST